MREEILKYTDGTHRPHKGKQSVPSELRVGISNMNEISSTMIPSDQPNAEDIKRHLVGKRETKHTPFKERVRPADFGFLIPLRCAFLF